MDNEEKLDLIIKLCEADVSMKSRELITKTIESLSPQEVDQIRNLVKEKIATRIADDLRAYNYAGQFASIPNFKEQLHTAIQTEIRAAVALQKPLVEKSIKDLMPSYLAEANIKAVIKSWAAGLK